MGSNIEGREDLDATAELHAACREIDGAIADLAARPLDERVADRMRAVLDGPQLQSARQTLARLLKPGMTAREALAGAPAIANSSTPARRLTVVSQVAADPRPPAAVEEPPGDDAEEPDRDTSCVLDCAPDYVPAFGSPGVLGGAA